MDPKNATDWLITEGVTFHNMRAALAWIYFGFEGMTADDWEKANDYVVPMQHNIMNPIALAHGQPIAADDTIIEYWIDDDERITQDGIGWTTVKVSGTETDFLQTDECVKLARVTLRFIGAKAEAWAKLFHHITRRPEIAGALNEYCNATALEYIGPIRPINVDYFGTQNTAVAYDIVILLQYTEVVRLPGERLGLVSIASGDIILEEGGM